MYGYIYRIGWSAHNQWYIGSRYKKNCAISDMWTTYFTSCPHVKRFAMIHGKPDIVEILKSFDESSSRQEILSEEYRLMHEYDAVASPNYFNYRDCRPKNATPVEQEKAICSYYVKNGKPLKSATSIGNEFGISRQTVYNIWKRSIAR